MQPRTALALALTLTGLACSGAVEQTEQAQALQDVLETPPRPPAETVPQDPEPPTDPALTAEPVSTGPTRAALQALTPTSGSGAEALIDGDTTTSWTPTGDGAGEGVLLRFEEPLRFRKITLTPCEDAGDYLEAQIFIDANLLTYSVLEPGQPTSIGINMDGPGRSLFLSFTEQSRGPCLSEITVEERDGPITLLPPRNVSGSVTTSSTLEPIDAYHPAYLFDGRPDFGWVEGASGHGTGEWVDVRFDSPVEIHALELWNGYQRSDTHFTKNARATRLRVQAGDGEPTSIDVANTTGPQRLALPEPVTVDHLRLEIEDAAPGDRYPDLVLSELRFHDADGPFTVRTTDREERQQALLSAVQDTPIRTIVDRIFISVCDVQDGKTSRRTLRLRSNHTFAAYRTIEKSEDDHEREIVDGAWVINGAKPQGFALDLFGRRQQVAEGWRPYEGSYTRRRTSITGGTVKVIAVRDLDQAKLDHMVGVWMNGASRDYVSCLGDTAPYDQLVSRDAFFIRGTTVTDLFWNPL